MSTITIPIEDEDLRFLKTWTHTQGTTVEEFFAMEARNLRRHLELPLHPDLINASGVMSPEIDARAEVLRHLAQKHA